jgi:hypothetical protein
MITVLIYWWALYVWRVECFKEGFAYVSCLELIFVFVCLVPIWWNDRR